MPGWREYEIRLEILDSYRNWTRRDNGVGSAMEPFDDKRPRLSWENCPAKGCPQLFEGKIWKCPPLAYLQLQARKYDLSERWKPYLEYQPLTPDCTPDELSAFFERQEEPCCGMCTSKTLPLELPLPFVARPSAKLVAWRHNRTVQASGSSCRVASSSPSCKAKWFPASLRSFMPVAAL